MSFEYTIYSNTTQKDIIINPYNKHVTKRVVSVMKYNIIIIIILLAWAFLIVFSNDKAHVKILQNFFRN